MLLNRMKAEPVAPPNLMTTEIKPNNVLERTAAKALVSSRRCGMIPAGMSWLHHQAVAQHERSWIPE